MTNFKKAIDDAMDRLEMFLDEAGYNNYDKDNLLKEAKETEKSWDTFTFLTALCGFLMKNTDIIEENILKWRGTGEDLFWLEFFVSYFNSLKNEEEILVDFGFDF